MKPWVETFIIFCLAYLVGMQVLPVIYDIFGWW